VIQQRESRINGDWAYARVPLSVLADATLKRIDVAVYAAISSTVWQGRVGSIGNRQIALIARVSQPTASRAISRLVNSGHIKIAESKGKGYRAIYMLTSPVFGQKQGKVNVVRSTPRGKRLVSVEKIA
jgi:hypothetical protein